MTTINEDFIKKFVILCHKKFEKENNWCEISDKIDYTNPKYQLLYALRYIPAYYFEYCVLASKLKQRLRNLKINYVEILSLGCGLSPDYFALHHNMDGIKFKYTGYDSSWGFKKRNSKFYEFHKKDISTLNDVIKFDVFIFPKSIGDINNSNSSVIGKLARKIAITEKKRIFFLNSYVANESQNTSHVQLFKIIHNALVNKDFNSEDNYEDTYYCGTKQPQGLIAINSNFKYPQDGFIVCDDKNDCKKCRECNVIKNPILTNTFMDYQILEYYR